MDLDLKDYLKTHPKTYLIFDLDETLVNLNLPFNLLDPDIKDFLVKLDPKIYQQYQNSRITVSQMENAYITKYPHSRATIIKNRAKFEAENITDVTVNQSLVDFIKQAKGYQFFLWSSNMRHTVKVVLVKIGILKKFTRLITRNDVNFLKPDPEGFSQIKDPQIPKENYLMIGDNDLDCQAARAAGIDFYLETYFHRNKYSKRSAIPHVCHSQLD